MKCYNCGHKFEVGEGYYKEDYKEHCEICHPKLYTDEEWRELVFCGKDGDGEDIYSDYYFYTTYEGD